MKIALIGTHGTGKTTAVFDITARLKQKGKNAAALIESTAFCPFPINQDTSIDAQRYLLADIIKNELTLKNKFDYIVCDRSALDTYIYALNAFGTKRVAAWERFVLDYMKSYNCLFKLPLKEEYLKEDGVRDTKLEFQKKIDVLFDNYLYCKGIDYIQLNKNKDYTEQVLSHLKL